MPLIYIILGNEQGTTTT